MLNLIMIVYVVGCVIQWLCFYFEQGDYVYLCWTSLFKYCNSENEWLTLVILWMYGITPWMLHVTNHWFKTTYIYL